MDLDPTTPIEKLPRLLTRKQAAAYLQISPRSLKRWIDRGFLHQVTLVGSSQATRIRREEIERLIDEGDSLTGSTYFWNQVPRRDRGTMTWRVRQEDLTKKRIPRKRVARIGAG